MRYAPTHLSYKKLQMETLCDIQLSSLTSLMLHTFPMAINGKCSKIELKKDLKLINQWAHQSKMLFNPDLTKQAIKMFISHKSH